MKIAIYDNSMCSLSGPPSMLVTAVNSILSYVGIELAPAVEDSSKPVR